MSEFILKDSLDEDDVFYCFNDDCGKEMTEESEYDWMYLDNEAAEFICKHCGARHRVEIDRPIIRNVFIEEDEEDDDL